MLDVDVKPNRGDALSIVGLAREVAAITGSPLRFPPSDVAEAGRPTAERLAVEVASADLCPRFVGRWVERRDRRAVARTGSRCACSPPASARSATSST